MIETKNLSLTLGNKSILKDVCFNLKRGEFVGILGPNGSGKTSLLRVLGGIYPNYSGSATLHLIPTKNLKPKGLAKMIAVVPQEEHFPFSYSALEVVLMGRTPYVGFAGFDSAEDCEIARLAMQQTDCWSFATRLVDTLSGGEKQRLLIARALAQKTPFILLDEPSTHLDLAHQQSTFTLLRRLAREQNVGVACITHEINLAHQYCDRIYLIKEGHLLGGGSPESVLTVEKIKSVFGISSSMVKTPDGKVYHVFL